MAIERQFIREGMKEVELRQFLSDELKRAGLADVVIQRTPMVTRIIILCDRPALVIGRKGRNIKELTNVIERNFEIEKPEIEVKKVEEPNLEPNIVAYRISSALERDTKPRKIGYKALQAIRRAGAKGAEITMSGKLVGKGGRARVLKMSAGYLKKCGNPSFVQVLSGFSTATCKPGKIGIKVSIVPKDVHFPDEINIISEEEFDVVEVEEEVSEGVSETQKEKATDKKKASAPAAKKAEKKEEKPDVKEKKEEQPDVTKAEAASKAKTKGKK